MISTGENTRDLPLIVAQLPIFSKAYYAQHDFTKTTLEPPLGSGPYAIGGFKQGQSVTLRAARRTIGARTCRSTAASTISTKSATNISATPRRASKPSRPGLLDLKEDFSSKSWATAYAGLPAIKEGRLIKEELPDETMSGAQGFYINLRREKFHDIRVRKALDLAFDFEWSNSTCSTASTGAPRASSKAPISRRKGSPRGQS